MPVPGAAILFPGELTFMVGTGLLRCRSEFATEPGGTCRRPMPISNRPDLKTVARPHIALPYRVVQHLQDVEVPDPVARLQG
jgi:hypothetical protein